MAGLIKTALALHHKVLPPTLLETPNPKCNFDNGPLYLNGEARPWIHGSAQARCAGVSAFGFGGTNFHLVLEENANDVQGEPTPALRHWPAELLVWRRQKAQVLLGAVEECRQALMQGAKPALADLALSLWKANRPEPLQPTLAIIAASVEDLNEKLGVAIDAMRSSKERLDDPRGIYYDEKPVASGKIAFVFPGQGSQYPNMLGELAMTFGEVRDAIDWAQDNLADRLEKPLGRYMFPPTSFSPEQEQAMKLALMRTEVAQPAVGAADLGMFHLLRRLRLEPDFLAGHSYGEYVALCAAGALAEHDLPRLSHERGKIIVEASSQTPGSMAAFDAPADIVERLVADLAGATVANKNAPRQTVISGTEAAIEAALAKAKEQRIYSQRIAVSCGFHSPLVAHAREPLTRALARFRFATPKCPVFSNTTAAIYPSDPSAISALLAQHLVSPVLFHQEILAMYEAGARIFVEVGPQGVLTGLIGQILTDKPHFAVASDIKGRRGLVQLQHLLGQLLVRGLPVELDRLYAGRELRQIDFKNLLQETGKPKLTPSTWMINSWRSRPLYAPEPILVGQPRRIQSEAATPSSSLQVVGANPISSTERMLAGTSPASKLNGGSHPDRTPKPTVPIDEETQVVLRYQELMAKFLETQKSVMASYFQGVASATKPIPAPVANSLSAEPVMPAPATTSQQANVPEVKLDQAKPVEMDRIWLTAQLLDWISKRTGYPKEMLALDQDLEADLGIDSIKRVEILGNLAEAMEGGESNVGSRLEMEKLVGLKSVRGIVDYVTCALGLDHDGAKPQAFSQNGAKPDSAHNGGMPRQVNGPVSDEYEHLQVQRALVQLVDAPLPSSPGLLAPGGVVVFTDDGRGIAREIAGRLADLGLQNILVRHHVGAGNGDAAAAVHYGDLTDPDAVETLLKEIRQQHGPIAGVVHLLPLAEPPRAEGPMERMQRELKSLYLLARGLEQELRQAGSAGPAVLLTATSLGGGLGFGDQPLPDNYFGGHGGIIGFVKCLALEWPEVLVRVVDLDIHEPKGELAERLLAELSATNGPTEVGYLNGRRITWKAVAAPLYKSSTRPPILNRDSTVVITGGARGITAAVALELAKSYQPRLIIVGRSALPDAAEAPETASLTTPAEIKSNIIARMQREGRPVVLATVEAAFHRLMQDREIRCNLARIAQAGARVHYYQVDVRDLSAMTGLLEEVETRFGGIEGVIHGAGIMEDKLVKDKTPDSFDRVFGTKAASAVLLSERLKPQQLKFCVFFASITSRYGNKGQSDYAAANETLSKYALQLDRRWPCRVLAVAWGPWSSIGMTADLERHLTQRGLKLISPEQGPRFLVEELEFGRKGETEVIIAGATEEAAKATHLTSKATPGQVADSHRASGVMA
jgi:malonyl CoA-acyl carrier protein transacylase/NADP-dependent 3-hydroxy acid dehydrogenase YdfG